MWQHRASKTITALVLLVAMAFLLVPRANAQEFGITAFPATVLMDLKPGTPTRILIQFKNRTDTFISGRIKVFDYLVVDKDGTAQLYEPGQAKPKYAAASWVKPEVERVTLAPQDYVAVNLTVSPPAELTSCGAYAAVVFEDESAAPVPATGRAGASAISARVGSLLIFRTKQEGCVEELRIVNMVTPSFLEYGPIPLSFDIVNAGEVHVLPELTLKSTGWLGAHSEKKLATRRIFPETAKSYSETIGKKWLFGPQTLSLVGSYGLTKLPIAYTTTVWVLPWRLLLGALLLILILMLLLKRYTGTIKEREDELQEELSEERKEIDELKKKLSRKEE